MVDMTTPNLPPVRPELLTALVRAAGAFHFVTLTLASRTPIPPHWERNLARLPLVHRRFAIAQNYSIGAMIAGFGLISLALPGELVSGAPLARAVCLATAIFWGGRLAVLPWIRAHRCCVSGWLKAGLAALMVECAAYALGYGWLAVRAK